MNGLTVHNLNKSFGKHHVLKDVSFSVEAGEIVGFIGPNGSGKSTTMKCIANLIYPNSGEISISGHSLGKQRNQALAKLSALIEAPGLYYNLSGLDNLHLFANFRGMPRQRVEEIIEFTGLERSLKQRVSTYSMGMKQRLALGIAILTQPQFLILDEPFNGLDPHGVFELRELIKQLGTQGCGILFSSHQILEMEKISDRNIFIKDGEIIATDQGEYDSMNTYKFFVQQQHPDLSFLQPLKEDRSVTDFQAGEGVVLITLASSEYLSPVLAAFHHHNLKITGIVPLTSDIENLYNNLYPRGAL